MEAYNLPAIRGDVSGVAIHTSVALFKIADALRAAKRGELTDAQINILALLLEIGLTVTPYKRLALELERHYAMRRSPEAVRRTVERLAGRGFLRRRKAKEGTAQGVIFQLVHELLCPHIRPPGQGIHPDARSGVLSGVRSDPLSAPSILEKKDRESLSISSQGDKERLEALAEEDIAFLDSDDAAVDLATCPVGA